MPGIANDAMKDKIEENSSPRGGKTTFDLTLTPTILTKTDTSQKCKLSPLSAWPKKACFFNGTTLTPFTG